jgi:dihydrofolate reductase
MKFFMKATLGHCILSGRKNFESIPAKFRPLKNRTNIVVTTQKGYCKDQANLRVVHKVQEGIDLASSMNEKELFIIGGGQVYEQTIQLANRLYLTQVKHKFEGDTHFPSFDKSQWEEKSRIIHTADEDHLFEMHFTVLDRYR